MNPDVARAIPKLAESGCLPPQEASRLLRVARGELGSNKERAGFTAEPLFEDIAWQRLLEAAATVASLSPEARTLREEPRLTGGGGEFGGGGSNSEF